ncbi:MAG: VOC family protein [Deltaproteobacteria bacterium]|nr:MAG: VOC family protein [Deltaproteobacteria bacterium]
MVQGRQCAEPDPRGGLRAGPARLAGRPRRWWPASLQECFPEPAVPTAALTSVILAVDDLARARAFYDAVLGWPARIEAPVFVELGTEGGTGVGLYLRRGFAMNPGADPLLAPSGGVTATELYVHVDDVDAAVAAGIAAGGRLLSAASLRGWGERVAYLADPDGNVVGLASR